MSTVNVIKSYFNTGDKPSEAQYHEWITDTYQNIDNLATHISSFDHAEIAKTKAKVDALGSDLLLFQNNSAAPNIALGKQSLNVGTSAYRAYLTDNLNPLPLMGTCIAIGEESAKSLVDGEYNVVVGHYSFLNATNGSRNIVLGHGNFRGDGNDNLYLGTNISSTTTDRSNFNIVLGNNSLNLINNLVSTNSDIIVIGHSSLGSLTTGIKNISIGNSTVSSKNPSDSIFIGHNISLSGVNSNVNNIILGNDIDANEDNATYIGNVNTTKTYIKGNVILDKGILLSDGGISYNSKSVTDAELNAFDEYDVLPTDSSLYVAPNGTNITARLPDGADVSDGKTYTFVLTSGFGDSVIIATNGGLNISGSSTYSLTTQYQAVSIQFFNDAWYIINRFQIGV